MSTRSKKFTSSRDRGILMVTALFLIVVLIAIAAAILLSANNSASSALSIAQKNRVYAAAEAGLNNALAAVQALNTTNTCAGGTVQGIAFTCTIDANNWNGTQPLQTNDPQTHNTVFIPKNSVLAHGAATLNGFRQVIVEGIIAPGGILLTGGAIRAKNNFHDNSHAPIVTNPPNGHNANVYVDGNIYASGNPSAVDGSTYAGGNNQLTTGIQNVSNAAQIQFPTPTQITQFQNNALAKAQSGTTLLGSAVSGTRTFTQKNIYINGNVNLSSPSDLITFTGGGYVYVNGNVSISGQAAVTNTNGSTFVITGTFSTSGQGAGYNTSGSKLGTVVVLGTGGASIVGNGLNQVIGLIWAPYGPVTMSGNGTIVGQLMSGNSTCTICDVTFNGGGSSGKFVYQPNTNGTFFPTNPTITAYGER